MFLAMSQTDWHLDDEVKGKWSRVMDGAGGLRKARRLSWMHCLMGNGFGEVTGSEAVSSTVK